MLKVALVVGTRPEAIKMAPLAIEMKANPETNPLLILTAQHRSMCDDVLQVFDLKPDYDLDIMKPDQSLFEVTARLARRLEAVMREEMPDLVLVQGDTTSTFMGGLCAYYLQIPVGHVEAGLRTYRKYSPFPEEINRKLTTAVADLHFAPTDVARDCLLREGVDQDKVFVVGNPVIDALLHVAAKDYPFRTKRLARLDFDRTRIIAVTAHRRESFGEPFRNMMVALREIAARYDDVRIVFPVHPNPNVRDSVRKVLQGAERVLLVEPLDYKEFVRLLKYCYFIITDSGGIQEEAPSLSKPVLLMREVTERPEAVEAGAVRVVGTDSDRIIAASCSLLDSEAEYKKMVVERNPYGDGKTSQRIVEIILDHLSRVEGS